MHLILGTLLCLGLWACSHTEPDHGTITTPDGFTVDWTYDGNGNLHVNESATGTTVTKMDIAFFDSSGNQIGSTITSNGSSIDATIPSNTDTISCSAKCANGDGSVTKFKATN